MSLRCALHEFQHLVQLLLEWLAQIDLHVEEAQLLLKRQQRLLDLLELLPGQRLERAGAVERDRSTAPYQLRFWSTFYFSALDLLFLATVRTKHASAKNIVAC